jgi:hypothetical protein
MSQITIDYDTVGLKNSVLGNVFDYHVANPFYLFAPSYYQHFYASYLMPCIALYNGSISGIYDKSVGFTSQKLLPSIMRGLSNVLFANGIDFSSGNNDTYKFMKDWAKKCKFTKNLKKCYINSGAGGTSLLKLNRGKNRELFVTQHRIDTFFIDVDSNDKIVGAKIYIDSITNTVKTENSTIKGNIHYGICEERYFNENGQPCVKASVYRGSANMQTETLARPNYVSNERVNWEELPSTVRKYIKDNYPSIVIGKEEYLPFKDYLGLMRWNFTEDLPQVAGSPFGQPIGDLLQTESLQYDQMKFFERNDVDIARARVLVPEDYINKDDPIREQQDTLSDRFYQKVSSTNSDNDKITPIQFQLRANEIKTEKENIYKDIALKLQLSASTIASFLNEGAGARTATEIISERTKTDTWIKSQISNIRDDLNEFLGYVCRYYDIEDDIEIVFKCEDQAPQLDKMKANSDVFGAGHMTPRLYVKQTYPYLSQSEQEEEITYLTNMLELDLKQKELELNTRIAQFNAMTSGKPVDDTEQEQDKENEKVNNVDNDKNQ